MRILITSLALLLVGACAGGTPTATCAGNLYDLCLDEHDCLTANMNCQNFIAQGFQVCSKSCTAGDDASCGTTSDGKAATCGATGVCTPPAANDCVLPH